MNDTNMGALAPTQQQSSIAYVDPAAVAAAESAKARIQAAYIMAMQRPRSYDQARIKILEACARPSFADKAEYSKPVGGQQIRGASIRFVELALREWGNISSDIQVVYDDDYTRRIMVLVTDLETNTTFSASLQIAKTVERRSSKGREVLGERINTFGDKVFIVAATEDEVANKQAAAISKAIRNEGLRLLPQDIVEEALERARQTVQSRDKADPDAGRKRLADAFASLHIMPTDLEAYLGHPLGQTSPAEMQELRSIYQSIKDGESKWRDYVEPVEDPDNPAQLDAKRRLQELKEKVKDKNGKAKEPEVEVTLTEAPLPKEKGK